MKRKVKQGEQMGRISEYKDSNNRIKNAAILGLLVIAALYVLVAVICGPSVPTPAFILLGLTGAVGSFIIIAVVATTYAAECKRIEEQTTRRKVSSQSSTNLAANCSAASRHHRILPLYTGGTSFTTLSRLGLR